MKIANMRWWIAGLIVGAAVLNYLDRSALSVASKIILDELQISKEQYGQIGASFLVAYAISYGLGGLLVDKLGTRLSLGLTIICWSMAQVAHGLAHSAEHLMIFRFGLGLTEAMFFPAAMRAIAEWFQPADRSKPVGLMLAGSLIGAILATIIVGWMMAHPVIGWRGSFFMTGSLGFILAIPLLTMTEPPARNRFLTPSEQLYLGDICVDPELQRERREPLSLVMGNGALWILVVARFMTDAVWYTLMNWVNLYLQTDRGFTPPMVAGLAWLPPAAADLGAITGGLASSEMIRRGWPVLKARTTCMFIGACFLPGSIAAFLMPQGATGLVLLFFGFAYFGHMFWGTNQLTCHQDLFGARRVATAMGITGAAGAIGGAVAQYVLGPYVDQIGFLPLFMMTAVLHPIAATIAFVGLSRRKALNASTGDTHVKAV